jgi:hypothetical protein
MNTKSITLSLIASTMFAYVGIAPAMAQNTNTPGIDLAQQQIRVRIQQGITSGQITQQEAQILYQREREIQFREIRMKRDGAATPQERRQLQQDLDDMRAEVETKLANRQVVAGQSSLTPGIDKALQLIRSRIGHGIQSGHITRQEADKLFARERTLHRHEAAFKSDGYMRKAERQQLREEVAMLNNDVERMMSNNRHN